MAGFGELVGNREVRRVLDYEAGLCHVNESRFYYEGNWESLDNTKEENDVIFICSSL